ncbi:DUF5522 domain-containing protein [Meiothermus sp. CFH 77666]|uniref:DUF5522 domain-containing protein n=1 Tax=Meiothermus sp. CFH 77666 TaxID=2817942 RepID=UPI001AA0506C|nr:DUF5522 domain-containing protein [Meiothermus sp. CFH 77666]MBO1438254.1 hypothetical protein [Meiothermus sp. CFH 77666]
MPRTDLQENVDYYLEGGLLVFTETYHLRRGYCCGSKCRHCPYPKEIQAQTIQLRLEGRPIKSREAFEARFGSVLVKP